MPLETSLANALEKMDPLKENLLSAIMKRLVAINHAPAIAEKSIKHAVENKAKTRAMRFQNSFHP